ncbi:hypothetical protein HDE_00343 [Halotydeus destructor]|nr:hypothetical protein HDE_00343 [Halotydeus destructor]
MGSSKLVIAGACMLGFGVVSLIASQGSEEDKQPVQARKTGGDADPRVVRTSKHAMMDIMREASESSEPLYRRNMKDLRRKID